MKQSTALKILKTGQNVFLTGSAGTGKTYLLQEYINYLKSHDVSPAITAPTGVAASHLDGMTIHSFFGLGIRNEIDDYYVDSLTQKKYLNQRLVKLKVLIIDEISMVSPEIFSAIDKILKAFKFSDEPFGGVQVIVSGDFFQLPPISKNKKEKRFAWQSEIWKISDFSTCYLEEKFRQEDSELIGILDDIRGGEISEKSYKALAKAEKNKFNISFRPTKLYTHNIDVDRINKKELDALSTKPKVFTALTQGSQKNIEKIFKSSLVLEDVVLKKEAIVLFIKNNYEKGYINGTTGKVIDFEKNGDPIVEIFSGRKIVVEKEDWSLENDDGKILATVSQIPLRLAWAITVHKSQGMSLDYAEIDLSKTFETGQGYVALSRVRSTKGLKLIGFNKRALEVDSLILFVDEKMKSSSKRANEKIKKFSEEERDEIEINFLEKIGASLEEVEYETQNIEEFVPKQTTYEKTANLIEEFDTLEEIAEHRGISVKTILKHFEVLSKNFEVDLSKFKPEKEILVLVQEAVEDIGKKKRKKDFLENGNIKLRAIFDYLDEEIGYEDIQLALLFL